MKIPKKKRRCLYCGKAFKPMTDELWKYNKRRHDESLRHKKYVPPKPRNPSAPRSIGEHLAQKSC